MAKKKKPRNKTKWKSHKQAMLSPDMRDMGLVKAGGIGGAVIGGLAGGMAGSTGGPVGMIGGAALGAVALGGAGAGVGSVLTGTSERSVKRYEAKREQWLKEQENRDLLPTVERAGFTYRRRVSREGEQWLFPQPPKKRGRK